MHGPFGEDGKIQKILEEKSIVFTSGSGGIFKSGIPIGSITINEQTENYKTRFFSNLSQLTFVKLVSFKKEDVN